MESTMSDSLRTYLNDHLAGSVAALQLMDHLIRTQHGSASAPMLIVLRREIEEDKSVLQGLLDESGGKESKVRQAAAWLTEKLGRAKLRLDDPGTGKLHLLEALEALALGIQGKAALWRALAAAEPRLTRERALDFTALERRALDQFHRVDALRLQVAPAALSF
jgi:hypothetical protein